VPATGNLLNAPSGTALERGYAVASTDGGHNGGQSDVSFGRCGGDGDAPLACTDLTTARLGIANLQVASAVEVAASGALPAHCKVNGALNARTGIDGKPYAIGFELRTPAAGGLERQVLLPGVFR